MSYLNFVPDGSSPSGKTKRWKVETLGGIPLMLIGWYSSWRKYAVIWTDQSATFDAGCLREVADFTEARTREHKS